MITKTNLLLLVFTLFSFYGFAQKKAVTENGDQVILYNNGSWKYADQEAKEESTLPVNSTKFKKESNASFLIKSKNGNIGFWVDTKKWKFNKPTNDSDGEFGFELKGQSVYATVVTEPVGIPLESLKQIALVNGKSAAPDFHIVHEEYRTVNGLMVMYLQSEGTQMGLKFSYSGYYYSNATATVQFIVYSYQSTMKNYHKEAEQFLNGLDEVKVETAGSSKASIQQSDASLTQGAFSPANNCKSFFEGKWNYNMIADKVNVERTLSKTVEYQNNKKFMFEYDSKWIDNCRYELIFKRTTKPNYIDIKVGEKIVVEILEINKEHMTYKATF